MGNKVQIKDTMNANELQYKSQIEYIYFSYFP